MLNGMAREPKEFDELLVPFDVRPQSLPADVGLPPAKFFPPPTATTPEGLLCVGGRLSPEWLLDAYSHGIFPWPMWDDDPVAWWSPDPRAVIEVDGLHIARRLRRTMNRGCFQVTLDRDFEGVIRSCATVGDRPNNTWLTPSMIAAYCRMHELGHAHSVEVWSKPTPALGDVPGEGTRPRHPHPSPLPKGEGILGSPRSQGERTLVGGTYGVAIGGLFAAESMFHHVRDASKVAVAHLVAHLKKRGYQLLDIQQWTPHTGRMGAVEISRLEYLRRLAAALAQPVTFGERPASAPE
jgi:leucyl/phenylalanyl-tRNA---protein transferase